MRCLVCTLLVFFSAALAHALPVQREEVREGLFHGRVYLPANITQPAVAVLLIGGSEGHLYLADEIGPKLAEAGFPVLGVDYHDGFQGARPLANVPIETFTAAAVWLHQSAKIHAQRVIALGDSRGSEAATLAAANSGEINGLALFVPSSLVWGPTGPNPPVGASAWTVSGKPLPFVNADPNARGAEAFQRAMETTPAASAVRLPIERTAGPILLAGSDGDGVWPSGEMVRQLAARLHDHSFQHAVTIFLAPASSHRMLGIGPSSPDETYTYPGGSYTAHFGGTAAGTEKARDQSWAYLLTFLRGFTAGAL